MITLFNARMTHFILFGFVIALSACATSPLGRQQLILLPESQMSAMGISAYQQMKEQQPLSKSLATNEYVNCVANAITATLKGSSGWEVNVFADDSANAFALPGKKIGVNQGLLKVAETPDQLASVIGHEVGHVLAQHGNERMSIQFATETGLQLLQTVSGEATPMKQQIFGLLGMGSQVGIALPFSREHESEADVIGLQLMAKAGFNPQASVELWQNMSKLGGEAPPEILSTHPANSTRIKKLQRNMEEAQQLYQQAIAQGRSPQCKIK